MKNILLVFSFVIVFFSGCGEESETKVSFDNSLRGEWIYVDSGKKVYLDETFDKDYTKVDDTLLIVDEGGVDHHLIRYGNDSTVVKGNIYTNSNIARALKKSPGRGIGKMDVVLKHYVDEKNNKKTESNEEGSFEFTNVQTGEYTLEAIDKQTNTKVSADIEVYDEELSIGSFKLVSADGYNFKTEYVINNSKGGYLFADQEQYNGKILIKNIGNKKGIGLNYTFSSSSAYIESMKTEIVLGTVDINKSIEVPFSISFNLLDKDSVSIPIDVMIKDANGNSWYDTFFLHVYQTPLYLNIATKKANIKGYVIDYAHQLKKINTSKDTVILPYLAGKSYYLVLSNPNINNETSYSIGFDTEVQGFEDFRDTSAFEPNNKETESTTLYMKDSIVSYLHEGDIDYYELKMNLGDMGKFSPPQMPFK